MNLKEEWEKSGPQKVIQVDLQKEWDEAEQKEIEDPHSFKNLTGAAVEPLMTMATGFPANVAGGLSGLGTIAANVFREDDKDPSETIRSVAEAMTYQPRTSGGKTALEAISYPFRKFAEGTEALGKNVTEREQRMGSSPEMSAAKGTLVKTAGDIIPMLLGSKAIKGKPHFPKIEKAIKGTAKAPAKAVQQVAKAIKEGVSHRLPGGHERAVGSAVTEMLGPRANKVVKALEKAKSGETAGQAASRTGSYEFSALQKMAKDRDPSGYGDIARGQHHARLKDIKKIGKSPEKLSKSESLMRKHADEGYGKVQNVKTDITMESFPEKFASRPSFKRALAEAKESALEQGPKGYFPKEGESFTVGNLQRIKRSMADELKPTSGTKAPLKKTQIGEVSDTTKDFTKWLREKSPDFAKAEDLFAQEIKHVNRMKIGQAMGDKLKPKLGAKERATQFANAVDDAGKLVKNETGQYQPIDKILKPKQMSLIYKAKNQLDRDVRLNEQAIAGNKRMNQIMGTMHDIPKVTILERAIVIMNALLKRIEGRNQAATLDLIAKKMKSPSEMARIIKNAKPVEAKFLKSIDPEIVAGMIAALEKEDG